MAEREVVLGAGLPIKLEMRIFYRLRCPDKAAWLIRCMNQSECGCFADINFL